MRLIDAEAFDIFLEKTIGLFIQKQTEQSSNDLLKEYKTGYALGILLGVQDSLKSQPTIEAKPVVHAHWKSTDKADHKPCRIKNPEKWVLCECSACGHKNGMRRNYKFCPYCGATMDEFASDTNVESKGVKIPVINMEDVPKIMEEIK